MSEQDEIWERDDIIAALRARVAKLEAALRSIWEQDDGAMGRLARAALKDAPQ